MSILALLNMILSVAAGVLSSLKATNNPAYVGVITSAEAGIAKLQEARDHIITKAELESLRTTPKW